VKVSFGIYKIVGCRKKNVGVQEEEALCILMMYSYENNFYFYSLKICILNYTF